MSELFELCGFALSCSDLALVMVILFLMRYRGVGLSEKSKSLLWMGNGAFLGNSFLVTDKEVGTVCHVLHIFFFVA